MTGLVVLNPYSAIAAENQERARVALVLSGGAARGAAHVGVFKVMEENRIPIGFIAGTSIGAIVGGVYASGVSPEELNRTFTSEEGNHAFYFYHGRGF